MLFTTSFHLLVPKKVINTRKNGPFLQDLRTTVRLLRAQMYKLSFAWPMLVAGARPLDEASRWAIHHCPGPSSAVPKQSKDISHGISQLGREVVLPKRLCKVKNMFKTKQLSFLKEDKVKSTKKEKNESCSYSDITYILLVCIKTNHKPHSPSSASPAYASLEGSLMLTSWAMLRLLR